jgi:hypothetical protein
VFFTAPAVGRSDFNWSLLRDGNICQAQDRQFSPGIWSTRQAPD